LVEKTADSADLQAREMEKGVNRLIEQSAEHNIKGQFPAALEKAKEAGKKERLLCRHREKNGLGDQMNYDLTYAVCFNLANQYHANGMLAEALNTYSIVVKNKQYTQSGRLRVNMGNIYYQQKKYPAAIKMYRMAMDQLGNANREMRFKIMRNIGISFVRLGQFHDAIQSFETVMDQAPDGQTGFNLIVCYYAVGDRDKMKKGFMQLLGVQDQLADDEEDEDSETIDKDSLLKGQDDLKQDMKIRKKQLQKFVQISSKLIAPVIEKDMSAGFDWVIEYLKAPRRAPSPIGNNPSTIGSSKQCFPGVAMEMEIAKGIAFLKKRNIKQAIEVFKSFEKKDQGLVDQAATNLSFLYFLEGDYKNAEIKAELAVKTDRYNAKALVNKANILFVKQEFESARELYLEAIGVEADCVEAIYNLGLTNKRLNSLDDALQAFRKLHRLVPKDPQVIYQIANLYDIMGDGQQAAEWFKILHGVVPSDPKALSRLGSIYCRHEEDDTNAFHNFSDSYHVYPVNMEVISWLGVWYVKSDLYEEAIQFFQRASEIEPHEVKWLLMVASCYRRMQSYPAALSLYKKIHKQDPENIECLKYLVTLCKELNDQHYEDFAKLLQQAERRVQSKESSYLQSEVPKDEDRYSQSQQQQQQAAEGSRTNSNQFRSGTSGQSSPVPSNVPQMAAAPAKASANERSGGLNLNAVDFAGGINEKGKNATIPQNNAKDDDWGDEELGDELLP
jgi:intraflagellar transport protein 88